MRSPLRLLRQAPLFIKVAIKLRPTGLAFISFLTSQLVHELRRSIKEWEPSEAYTSLRVAEAARRLAVSRRRRAGNDPHPILETFHVEMDALMLTLDELDGDMRSAAANGQDLATLTRAAVAMASAESSFSRMETQSFQHLKAVTDQQREALLVAKARLFQNDPGS